MAGQNREAQELSVAARTAQDLERQSAADPTNRDLRIAASKARAEVGGRVQSIQADEKAAGSDD